MTAKGNKVGEILEDLFVKLNYRAKYSIYTGDNPDTYEIQFPTIHETSGEIIKGENTKITEARVGNPDEDNVNYSYENPALIPASPTKQNLYNAKIISTTFNAGANIHDCIAGIIRDSEYITNIFKKPLKTALDANDMLDSFNVVASVIPIGWNSLLHKPIYNYIYKVVPHKIHYSRIPKYQNQNINRKKVGSRVRRSYNYLYTGKNLDILRFEINYNYLYYQSQANNDGLAPVDSGSHAAAAGDLATSPHLQNFSDAKSIVASGGSASPITLDTGNLNIASGGQNTRSGIEKNPAVALAKNFHKAILDNVGQSRLEIEILGDPYFLSQQGMNNFISKNSDNSSYLGMTNDGDMNYQTGEVLVEIKFRNPTDINSTTGMMDFSDEVTSYSGIYRLTNVVSKFNGGMFTQTLQLIKLEKQSENLTAPIDPAGSDGLLNMSQEINNIILQTIDQNIKSIPSSLISDMCTKWNISKYN
jgi:hypothetical protein